VSARPRPRPRRGPEYVPRRLCGTGFGARAGTAAHFRGRIDAQDRSPPLPAARRARMAGRQRARRRCRRTVHLGASMMTMGSVAPVVAALDTERMSERLRRLIGEDAIVT